MGFLKSQFLQILGCQKPFPYLGGLQQAFVCLCIPRWLDLLGWEVDFCWVQATLRNTAVFADLQRARQEDGDRRSLGPDERGWGDKGSSMDSDSGGSVCLQRARQEDGDRRSLGPDEWGWGDKGSSMDYDSGGSVCQKLSRGGITQAAGRSR